jgi:tetratricopeptide (TPR) repeat protein
MLLLALLVPAAFLVPVAARGQRAPAAPQGTPRPAAPDAGPRRDPESRTGISESMEALARGHQKIAQKDLPGAIALYKNAVKSSPNDPLGHYALGQAYILAEQVAEAETAYKQGLEVSAGRSTQAYGAAVRSKLLFAYADVLERQKRWADARAAWQAYGEHAAKLGDAGAGHPETARARIEAIEAWLELDRKYAEVRSNIAREKEDAGAAKK